MMWRMDPQRDPPLYSRFSQGVAKRGFRKWYERELLTGHAHLVLLLLSAIGMIGSFEAFKDASVSEKIVNVVFVLVCAAVGLWAMRRYLFLLMRAEELANQASCPACGEYGRFTVVADRCNGRETVVCCRNCAHKWPISQSD
jgi:hypothetical protein